MSYVFPPSGSGVTPQPEAQPPPPILWPRGSTAGRGGVRECRWRGSDLDPLARPRDATESHRVAALALGGALLAFALAAEKLGLPIFDGNAEAEELATAKTLSRCA